MIHAGQRWRAEAAPLDVIDVVRQVDDGLWAVRPEVGPPIEMTESYITSSYELVSEGETVVRPLATDASQP